MTGFARTERIPLAAALLGGAGVVPFAAAAAAQWLPLPFPAETALTMGLAYAAVILSFLGGVRWGTALSVLPGRRRSVEFALSVLLALAGWCALALPHLLGVGLLIAGFLLQGQWDVMTVEQGRLPAWFGKLRMLLTAAAVVALIAMLPRLVI